MSRTIRLMLALALLAPTALHGQEEGSLVPGMRVRVVADGRVSKGELVRLNADSLVMRGRADVLAIPLASLSDLHLRAQNPVEPGRLLLGGLAGAAAGMLAFQGGEIGSSGWALMVGTGAALGGALSARGVAGLGRARDGFLIAAAAGALLGTMAVGAAGEGEGVTLTIGTAAGGVAFGAVGAAIGALTANERWERVPLPVSGAPR
jgi:hypothetical protein